MIFTKSSIKKKTKCRQIGLYTMCIAQTPLYKTRATQLESVWQLSQQAQGIYAQAPLQDTEIPEAPL